MGKAHLHACCRACLPLFLSLWWPIGSVLAANSVYQAPLTDSERLTMAQIGQQIGQSLAGPAHVVHLEVVRDKHQQTGERTASLVLYDYAEQQAHYLVVGLPDGTLLDHQVHAQHHFPLGATEIPLVVQSLLDLPVLREAVETELGHWYDAQLQARPRIAARQSSSREDASVAVVWDNNKEAEELKVKATVYRPASHHPESVQVCRETRCAVLTLTLGSATAGNALNLTVEPVLNLVTGQLLRLDLSAGTD